MKNTQKFSVKRILEREKISISELSKILKIEISSLFNLLEKNKKLNKIDWTKIKNNYPEHLISGEIIL